MKMYTHSYLWDTWEQSGRLLLVDSLQGLPGADLEVVVSDDLRVRRYKNVHDFWKDLKRYDNEDDFAKVLLDDGYAGYAYWDKGVDHVFVLYQANGYVEEVRNG